jgi:hypothetical protein
MTREEWARIEVLFDEARQRTGPDRQTWLDASGVSPETRQLVERMLDSYDSDPGFLEDDSDPAG